MSGQTHRLPHGGRIDRGQPLRFVFDGRPCEGYCGDTVASALLANGIHLVGRSFKRHRPRGILSAGAEEPGALLEIGVGGRREPSVRATQAALADGLVASSQNCWPSVRFDLGATAGLLHRLLPPGFYYKTFMAPARLWPVYERLIRRMAGIGRAPDEPDPDRYEKMHAHCDVLVIGAGPAGLVAALAAARAGARVVLVDEQDIAAASTLADRSATVDGGSAAEWARGMVDQLAGLPEVRLLLRTGAVGLYDHGYATLVERVIDHCGQPAPGQPRQRLWKVRARQVLLATGAIERPLVFAGNDRPGVMLAGAVRAYLNRWAVLAGRRVLVACNNDDGYLCALDLVRSGATAMVADLRPRPDGALYEAARAAGIDVHAGCGIVRTVGRRRVKGATLMAVDDEGTATYGTRINLDCDLVAMAGGWAPTVHLFAHVQGRLVWDEERAAWLPGDTHQPVRCIGAAAGIAGLAQVIADGLAAGAAAAAAAGHGDGAPPPAPVVVEPGRAPARPLWIVPPAERDDPWDRHFVDLQNDVTVADLRAAVGEGYRSIEHVKRYTTLGMAPDQGKTGNPNAAVVLAAALGNGPGGIGTTSFRPPYVPTTVGAYAGRDVGALFDPVRRTAMHDWHVARGAVLEPAGRWLRPRCYPAAGEREAEAVFRESATVRQAVGLVDASTLGKIDVQGPDAAAFLERVYTNRWQRLAVGHCRYGVMLRDDGMVLDDGVTTRLAADRFHMTTTTSGAERVWAWLEDWLQTEWRGLRVRLTPVTEQWAVVAVAGPKARALLSRVTEGVDLAAAAFPFMTMREGRVCGIAARLFRISFSGELSFEVNVARRHGLALWEGLLEAGRDLGAAPYGTEAMQALRTEKGFFAVGHETDGTVSPLDLGLDTLVAMGKTDFLGQRSLELPELQRADRPQLVGLLTENPQEALPAGAQLVAEPRAVPPMAMVGRVTSSHRSPALGRSVALALVAGGRARHGEAVYAPLRDRSLRATIVSPVFYDPEGSRRDG